MFVQRGSIQDWVFVSPNRHLRIAITDGAIICEYAIVSF